LRYIVTVIVTAAI